MNEVLERLIDKKQKKIDLYNYPKFYDLIYKNEYPHNRVSQIIKQKAHNDGEVLSVGCGSGMLLEKLENFELTGIDKSSKMLEEASQKTDAKLMKGDITNRTLDKEFDVVEATGQSLNHVRNREDLLEALTNIKAMLKSDGNLLFDFYVDINEGYKFESRTFEIGKYEIRLQEDFGKIGKEKFEMIIRYEIGTEQETSTIRTEIPMYIPSKKMLLETIEEAELSYSSTEGIFSSDNIMVLECQHD